METAVFAGGCFWCTEAVFKDIKGVHVVSPGYAGGHVENPTYEQVLSGNTGHAEVVRVEYDPHEISYRDLLTVFFVTHDPTQLNQQGNDIGEQYRSAIFYTTEGQKEEAEFFVHDLKAEEVNVITTVEPLKMFWEAEDYHHDYFEKNKEAAYCQLVIAPKVKSLQEHYAELLKKGNRSDL
jgi:peptide-methionine (S)-S-oxide reductase